MLIGTEQTKGNITVVDTDDYTYRSVSNKEMLTLLNSDIWINNVYAETRGAVTNCYTRTMTWHDITNDYLLVTEELGTSHVWYKHNKVDVFDGRSGINTVYTVFDDKDIIGYTANPYQLDAVPSLIKTYYKGINVKRLNKDKYDCSKEICRNRTSELSGRKTKTASYIEVNPEYKVLHNQELDLIFYERNGEYFKDKDFSQQVKTALNFDLVKILMPSYINKIKGSIAKYKDRICNKVITLDEVNVTNLGFLANLVNFDLIEFRRELVQKLGLYSIECYFSYTNTKAIGLLIVGIVLGHDVDEINLSLSVI